MRVIINGTGGYGIAIRWEGFEICISEDKYDDPHGNHKMALITFMPRSMMILNGMVGEMIMLSFVQMVREVGEIDRITKLVTDADIFSTIELMKQDLVDSSSFSKHIRDLVVGTSEEKRS